MSYGNAGRLMPTMPQPTYTVGFRVTEIGLCSDRVKNAFGTQLGHLSWVYSVLFSAPPKL